MSCSSVSNKLIKYTPRKMSELTGMTTNSFYGPPAPYPDNKLFATDGYNTQSYVLPFSANTNIWSQQRTTNMGVGGRPLTGNYPDPIIQLRQKGADQQLRDITNTWKLGEERSNRQMKFNYQMSSTDTSNVSTREDTQENYARVLQKAPFEMVSNQSHLWILLLSVWFLF